MQEQSSFIRVRSTAASLDNKPMHSLPPPCMAACIVLPPASMQSCCQRPDQGLTPLASSLRLPWAGRGFYQKTWFVEEGELRSNVNSTNGWSWKSASRPATSRAAPSPSVSITEAPAAMPEPLPSAAAIYRNAILFIRPMTGSRLGRRLPASVLARATNAATTTIMNVLRNGSMLAGSMTFTSSGVSPMPRRRARKAKGDTD